MNLKELKNTILLSLYNRYEHGNKNVIPFTELCKEEGIAYDSLSQLSNAMASLKDSGYVSATFFVSGDGVVTKLTAKGIEFIEGNLLEKNLTPIVKQHPEATEKQLGSIDVDENKIYSSVLFNEEYQAEEKYKSIIDCDVEPCFSVNDLVDCFIKQIDKIAESKSENTPMIGVFAPWGRGKSYFLNRVFDVLNTRKEGATKKYNIITFNAWKHQDTPAIWAYLYESLYKETTIWQKLSLYFFKYIWTVKTASFIIIILLSWFLGWLLSSYTSLLNGLSLYLTEIGCFATYFTLLIPFIYTLKDNPIKAFKIINKYSKRKTYKEHLGIQNEIEEDIENVISELSSGVNKVILLVDDIDRCPTEKMVNIVDSLRTILENKVISEKLIIICSIDVEKLKNGYINAFPDNISEEKREILAREQIDKLFIFTMGLARLGLSQLQEYMRKIMSIGNISTESNIESMLIDKDRQNGSFYVAHKLEEQPKPISDIDIFRNITSYLQQNNIDLTPRKLRIIYYQILFANNILSKNGIVISCFFIYKLLSKSLRVDEEFSKDALGDVIDMAVPY